MQEMRETPATPAPLALFQMMRGFLVSQSIFVAAELGIADLVADGPKHFEALADETQTHAPSLYRLLRALASVGIFSEVEAGVFALTPMAALLQSSTPGSLRASALMWSREPYRAWGDMLQSVRTGETAFDRVFGMAFFPYLAQHPESAARFNAAMTSASAQADQALLAAYDFSQFDTVVDVGGGHGRLLASILRAHPSVRGVLFDQPHVVAGAEPLLQAAGVAERCQTIGGDFFREVPRGGEAYILARIVHDWDDEQSLAILSNCHRAMELAGKLLLIESVIAPGNQPDFGKFLDLHMLALQRGRERTEAEYGSLLAAAGFKLVSIQPTGAVAGFLPSVVEAVPL